MAKSWRRWTFLPAIPPTGAAFIVNTILIISNLQDFANYSDEKTGHFSFYDLPDGTVRSRFITAVSLSVVVLVALWAETIYFLIFFHRHSRVHRRCAIQASLSAAHIVFATATKVVDDGLLATPSALDPAATTKRPELTAEQYAAAYNSWRSATIGLKSRIVFAIAVADAAVHIIVLVFWLWLLPVRERLPNQYEPVIRPEKGRRLLGIAESRSQSVHELTGTADSVRIIGPLEAVFQEHERTRLLNRKSSSKMPIKATQGLSPVSGLSGGPQFDPVIRYWMVNPLHGEPWPVAAAFLIFFCIDLGVEIVCYALTRAYNLRCEWYCHLAIAYPWPIILWTVVIAVLLRMKIPFNRNIFVNGPRLDVFITCASLPLIALFLLVHVTRFVDVSAKTNDEYQDYIKSNAGRSGATEAMFIFKIIELGLALFLGICLLPLGHTVYKFYKAGRGLKKIKN